jgi:hypothetical protein
MQHRLNFAPEPHGHGALRPTLSFDRGAGFGLVAGSHGSVAAVVPVQPVAVAAA